MQLGHFKAFDLAARSSRGALQGDRLCNYFCSKKGHQDSEISHVNVFVSVLHKFQDGTLKPNEIMAIHLATMVSSRNNG